MAKVHKISTFLAVIFLSLSVLFPVISSADEAVDVCDNLEGIQETLPEGFHIDESGDCIADVSEEPVDVCPNLEGEQDQVPEGYQVDEEGNCNQSQEEQPTDVCPNLEDNQAEVPEGYELKESGDCVVSSEQPEEEPQEEPNDVCDNLEGIQETMPEDYIADTENEGSCIQEQAEEETDLCPNIEGEQAQVPEGYQIDDEGNCVQVNQDPQNNDDDGKVLAANDEGKVLAETLPDTGIAGSIEDFFNVPMLLIGAVMAIFGIATRIATHKLGKESGNIA